MIKGLFTCVLATATLGIGCFGGEEDELELGSTDQAVSVAWQNAVGVTATGNDLTKTSALATWKAGASSVQTLTSDGYAEFTTGESNTAKMAGLSVGDTNQSFTEIDYAIYMAANGRAYVYENGGNRGQFGTYIAGDTFRVNVSGGVVTYTKNGALLFTSLAPASFPLLLDSSFLTPNGTVNDAVVVSNLVHWQNAVGVSAVANNLVKTDAANTWKAGASSVEVLTGDGGVQFTTAEATTAKMAGLSVGDANRGYAELDFAFYLAANGKLYVYENGVNRGQFGSYVANDVFTVFDAGGTVTYSKNGTLLFTSLITPASPLRVDTSLRTVGATINGVLLVEP